MVSREAEDAFVARGAELEIMHRALSDARAGRPAIVLVEGEPGIGKTRLLRRFLDEAADIEVLRVSGDEAEISLDYGIVSQLLAEMPADLGRTTRPGQGAPPVLTASRWGRRSWKRSGRCRHGARWP